MKQLYLNLAIWAISSCTIALSAQTYDDNINTLHMSMYGKEQFEKPLKAMIKPQMPVVRNAESQMHMPSGSDASLRATAEAMKLDSIISYDNNGTKLNKTTYSYNEKGKVSEQVTYSWSTSDWILSRRNVLEYDSKGNSTTESAFHHDGSEWIINYKRISEYYNNNHKQKEYNIYYIDGEIRNQYYYEYNTFGSITKIEQSRLRNDILTITDKSIYEYDSENRRTHSETQTLNENGKWYYTDFKNYKYNSRGWQLLYETFSWNANQEKLFLIDGQYYDYNDKGKNIYNELKHWNGSEYERTMNKQTYDENGKITLYENLQDNQSLYRHTIEEITYTADDLSSKSYKKDTIIWKDDGNKDISYTSTDYKYNDKGQNVSSATFNVDPETNERVAKIASSETTYDSKYRTISLIQSYFDNGILSSGDKAEYKYIDDNDNYIYSFYYLNGEGKDWILSYKTKHVHEDMENGSYYYLDSSWNEETGKWEASSGYKTIYEGDNDNYTQMEYRWSKDAGDWVKTYGYRYMDEYEGENHTQIDAYFDADNNQWNVNNSYKKEVTEGNPKVCKIYLLPKNDIENWEFTGCDHYYYSESTVANEAIQTVDARIYTRPGIIHIDMEGVADLWVYTANGACRYHSTVSGTADVTNLQEGIYFVVLKSDSGVKKAKVLVK
ncbi:MAG: T9SS type A sorting domain-containing protein [Parabacteroides sp.]|nr:T9SS type A sorting domain-containing protein [Parabacteroides sp.]